MNNAHSLLEAVELPHGPLATAARDQAPSLAGFRHKRYRATRHSATSCSRVLRAALDQSAETTATQWRPVVMIELAQAAIDMPLESAHLPRRQRNLVGFRPV